MREEENPFSSNPSLPGLATSNPSFTVMQFFALLTIFLVYITFTATLPIGISYSEDLKTAIAQKRARERDLAILSSLSEEKRAYQLETVEVATFRYKRDIEAAR